MTGSVISIFALLMTCLSTTLSVSAAHYVVDANNAAASDSEAGSAEKPFKTITRAVKDLKPSGTVTIQAGVYREAVAVKASGARPTGPSPSRRPPRAMKAGLSLWAATW